MEQVITTILVSAIVIGVYVLALALWPMSSDKTRLPVQSKTPRVDALARDHHYESAAEAAGMVVSAKSLEDCYREMRDLAGQLEAALSATENTKSGVQK